MNKSVFEKEICSYCKYKDDCLDKSEKITYENQIVIESRIRNRQNIDKLKCNSYKKI